MRRAAAQLVAAVKRGVQRLTSGLRWAAAELHAARPHAVPCASATPRMQ